MTLANTLKALLVSASLSVSIAAKADERSSIADTAAHVLQNQSPAAALTAVEGELMALFDSVLTDAGKQAFYQSATPTIGGSTDVTRLGGTPTVYLLTLGSGDCEAGCIQKTRLYYEVTPSGVVTKIGETGDALDPDVRAQLLQ